ncbi:signal peptide peptidase SppA [Leptospira sarikeiensis]|uniref:Signal peptide peptidase SppA n=1 Tax=Leptospira sarikeiensis TaxID=2484943 RepID=A0A4R9K1K5_9LEPT|nr:signal peptide peptidase SppA [Leptospira sarikeiensis]TGL59589.1 signal peptide peptidase SppA [Leptospira sarikeiensis]
MKFLPYKSVLFTISFLFFSNCLFLSFPNQTSPIPKEKLVTGSSTEGLDKILLIPIEGEISDKKSSGSFLSGDKDSIVSRIKTYLSMAEKDPAIKAVILKIDSPGGSVTASDLIHHEILEFKKRKNVPVLSLFMDTAASGAYYLSMATDHIQAHPTTITGSIGVLRFGINAKEALDKLGIKSSTIRSGPNKATGNPVEEFTPEQKKVFQDIIMENYERFLSIIKKGRPKIKESELRKLADGRIYSANQALENGLIDSIGYFEDAVVQVTKLPGYKPSSGQAPKIVFYSYKGPTPENFYQIDSDTSTGPTLLESLLPFRISPDHKIHYLFSPE